MSATAPNAGLFFQTSSSLATSERRTRKAKNSYGDPVKFPSKVLAVCSAVVEGRGGRRRKVFVAEAAGEVKGLDLETNTTERIFSEGVAPLTSLAICPTTNTLFTGCWDKTIYGIALRASDTDTPRRPSPIRLTAHTDFVKCLLTTSIQGTPVLISGGADATIVIWDLSSANFGQILHKLKGHTKALQDLTIDPFGAASAADDDSAQILFSASSDREIRRWHISLAAAHELPESLVNPIRAHDTSVYALRWDADGDLWTASADNTAQHLVRSRDWAADTVLAHPDFVRDVYVADEARGLVVTACRDEHVRVWDASSGDLLCVYTGHFEEVTGLVGVAGGAEVVSASIDGTVRRWKLDRGAMSEFQERVRRDDAGEEAAEGKRKAGAGALTAEEEAELAELMDEDDE